MTRGALLFVLPLAAAAAGCIPEEGPQMRPGEDCLSCHDGHEAKGWNAAGTVYLDPDAPPNAGIQGATVRIMDSKGRRLDLGTNGAGNFYTREAITFPATVEIHHAGRVLVMPMPAQSGACNSCHNQPPQSGAPGRLFAP